MNGIVLGNRYELLEKIGEGGMSEVFKARCNKLNRFVAVKILKKEFCNNEDIVTKFKGEATAIATLSDNNIVNILDVGTQDDINYIVMEYVKGKTLKEVIKKAGKMNYETAISIAIEIAKALDCAHRNNIIHRDVKPQNILVTEDGVMKVTDFGIAKSTTSSTITNTSTIMGSAHYLSPEQAKGGFIDCRTDLYSLGVVLYEMVTGTLPFEADTAVTIAIKHLQEAVVPPKNINSRIPDSLNKLIIKAMQKDPNKRYQTAKEMINDLKKIKDNPNAIIDQVENDNEHTIIMPSLTEEISKQKNVTNHYDDEYEEDDEDDYYDDDEGGSGIKNKSKIIKIGIGIALSIILIILGVTAFKLVQGSQIASKEVQVPDIVGKTVNDAKKELTNLNLILVEAGTEVSDKPEGTILQINPTAGTTVKEKTEVRVIVSGGETKLKMPDLKEYDINTAKTILNSLGLKIDSTSEQFSDNIAKGQIISQNPAPDTEITLDDKITIVVSKGPEIKLTTVPNVLGYDVEDAKNRLSDAKLKYSVQERETSNESENGKVLSQSIEGSKVEQGTTVTITIGKYVKPQQTTKPENNGPNNETNGPNGDNSNGTGNNNGSNNGNNSNESNEEPNKPTGPWDDDVTNQTNTSGQTPATQSNQ